MSKQKMIPDKEIVINCRLIVLKNILEFCLIFGNFCFYEIPLFSPIVVCFGIMQKP